MLTTQAYLGQAPARTSAYSSLHHAHVWRYHNLKPKGSHIYVYA